MNHGMATIIAPYTRTRPTPDQSRQRNARTRKEHRSPTWWRHPEMTPRRRIIPTVLALLVCAALPFVLTEYEATLAGFVGIAAIAALGLVLLTGISGQTSFGHATFVGLAAYTTAWMSRYGGYPPLAGLPAALAVTGTTAFLLGLITSRISGHYLPLATIAWGTSFFYLFGVLPGLGGFNGFGEIPPLFPGITRGTAAALIGAVLIGAALLASN